MKVLLLVVNIVKNMYAILYILLTQFYKVSLSIKSEILLHTIKKHEMYSFYSIFLFNSVQRLLLATYSSHSSMRHQGLKRQANTFHILNQTHTFFIEIYVLSSTFSPPCPPRASLIFSMEMDWIITKPGPVMCVLKKP